MTCSSTQLSSAVCFWFMQCIEPYIDPINDYQFPSDVRASTGPRDIQLVIGIKRSVTNHGYQTRYHSRNVKNSRVLRHRPRIWDVAVFNPCPLSQRVKVNDLIVPRKTPWKRLRVYDEVKVSEKSTVSDTDRLSGLRQNLINQQRSRKIGHDSESRDAELLFPRRSLF